MIAFGSWLLESAREEPVFRPLGLCLFCSPLFPRLAPWAAFLRRYAAKARLQIQDLRYA
jgi:hypothetical protein